MIFRAIVFACAILMGWTAAAEARCDLNVHNWPVRSVNIAQNLARNSSRRTVREAYQDDECLITAILHRGGAPCPGTRTRNHVTVRVAHVNGAYHVFTKLRLYGDRYRYCTTH